MRRTQGEISRLLVYVDVPYRRDSLGFSTDRAFLKFVIELRSRFDQVVLVGRVRAGRSEYAIPAEIDVVALPDYPTLRSIGAVLAAVPQALRVLWREVGRADAVVAIGPHPLSLPTALFALARHRPLTLMVRQNYPEYIRHRLPSRRWGIFIAVAAAADTLFRTIARRARVVVVGDELAVRYGRSSRLLNLPISLMPAAAAGTHRGSDGTELRLLAITRLDSEKAPHLLIEAVELLNAAERDREVRLTVAGTGELRPSLERLARERVPGQVDFAGYLPHGEELFALYRDHDVLVHTAKTEGIPQVVIEAQFVGLPVVATDVGGVRGAVGGGTTALLVPPGDAQAIASAVARIVDDHDVRARLVAAGLEATRELTLQSQVAEFAAFVDSA